MGRHSGIETLCAGRWLESDATGFDPKLQAQSGTGIETLVSRKVAVSISLPESKPL